MNLMGSLALAYLAGAGLTSNTAVVGRGLFRAVRRAVGGEFKEAGVDAVAALTAPALMSYASIASLVVEVVEGAGDLVRPVLEEADSVRAVRGAA